MIEKRYYYDRALDKIKNRETGDDYWFLCDIADLLNKQDKRIKELEKELQNLQTFKKVLEYAEKDMEERADWQAYCEKEFEGL